MGQNYQVQRCSGGRREKWFAYSWSPWPEMVDPPLFRPPKMSKFRHLRCCFCTQIWLNRSRRVHWHHFWCCPMSGSRDIHFWNDRGAIFSKFVENLFVIIFMFRVSKYSNAVVRYEWKCSYQFFFGPPSSLLEFSSAMSALKTLWNKFKGFLKCTDWAATESVWITFNFVCLRWAHLCVPDYSVRGSISLCL